MMDAWHRIVEALAQRIPTGMLQLWVRPLSGALVGDALVLQAPNDFVRRWVESRLVGAIAEAAEEILGVRPAVEVGVADGSPATSLRPRQLVLPPQGPAVTQVAWRHGFDDFVVGPCNQLAYAAAQGFCRGEQGVEQLLLCAAPGLGKTHLAQAIGAEIARQTGTGQVRVCYVSAEEFASQLVQAIRSRTIEQFKNRFRSSVDLLLMEDVHFFQGKEKMQDELVNTLDALRRSGRHVVLTSSFLPRDLRDMDAHLTSRLTQGFLATMERPDYATRLAIIQDKARREGVHVPSGVAELLAQRLRSDVRQLESCLRNVLLRARLLSTDITTDLAWEILRNYDTDAPCLSLDAIISFVCQAYGISFEDLCSKSRKRDRVVARNTVFYLARKHTELSLVEIGRRLGRKHSTVIKGIASVEQEIARHSPLGRQIAHTLERLRV
jgi:chromosomal replication initiator protein